MRYARYMRYMRYVRYARHKRYMRYIRYVRYMRYTRDAGLSTAVMHAVFQCAELTDGVPPTPEGSPASSSSAGPGMTRTRTTTMDARALLPKSSLLSDDKLDEAARRLRACSPALLLELFPSLKVTCATGGTCATRVTSVTGVTHCYSSSSPASR